MRIPATLLPVTLAVLTLTFMLTACGSSATKTVVVTEPTIAPAQSSTNATKQGGGAGAKTTSGTRTTRATPTTAATTTETTPTSGATTTTALSPTSTVHLTNFRSPTGNIGCVILDGTARCDIAKRLWKPPTRPAACPREVDFGQGVEVDSSGEGHLVCAGDAALDPTATPLAYGDGSVEGSFTCVSAITGMTCINRADRHGFFISRESYRIF